MSTNKTNERKRKTSTSGSRKKRMLNLDSHELPDVHLHDADNLWRSPGKEKKQRKWKEGSRSNREGSSATGSRRPATRPSIPQNFEGGPREEGGGPVEAPTSADAWTSNDHELDLNDHGGPNTDDALGPPPADAVDSDATDYSTPDSDHDYELETYAEAVNTNVAGFQPVFGRLFVVQGWDTSRLETTNTWFHLKFEVLGSGELSLACTCPRASYCDCIHIRYFDQYRVEDEALDQKDVAWPLAVIFSQRIMPGVGLHTLFSVQSNSVVELRGRAIVSHEGIGRDQGLWKCSKDTTTTSCYHIHQAKALLPEDFGEKIAAARGPGGSEVLLSAKSVGVEPRGPGRTVSYLPIHPPHWARLPHELDLYTPLAELRTPAPDTRFPLDNESTCADDDRTKYDPNRPISTKTCKLYSLLSVYPVEVEVQSCPRCPHEKKRYIGPDLRARGIFNYNNSILVCHELLDEYTSEFTSSETPFGAFVLRVSRRYKREGARFMGDDLFRSVWFSYAYLQRLTNDMTCGTCGPSPTTVIFDGITLGYGRKHIRDSLKPPTAISEHSLERKDLRYYRHQQLLPDALLRRRVRASLEGPDFAPLLEDLEERLARMPISLNDEETASPSSTTTTSDFLSTPSITRSFALFAMRTPGTSAMPSSLPATPTKTCIMAPSSPMRQPDFSSVTGADKPVTEATRGLADPGFSRGDPFGPATPADSTVRPPIPASVTSPPPALPPSRSSPSKRGLTDDEAKARKRLLVREHLVVVDWIRTELLKQGGPDCPELAALFDKYFGQLAYAGKVRQSKSIHTVWKNLFMQLAAEESVLQMVNFKSWEQLVAYLADPTFENRSKLVSIPAFYKALTCKDCDIVALNSVMRWVERKVRIVLSALISQASPPIPLADPNTLPNDEDWMKTGCYYSMPIIRHRPKYPRLDDTEKSDKSGPRGDRCGKYYSEYKEKRLTGGIMVCWCQHSVCYGFHTIPESEGRNDVFSAMVTRWPLAPERVIYDFACALGPYCMTREPQFFGNTYFMIDHFHAAGHTKCSPAAFLWEYENTDPQLSSINSSAAECGNGALRRIRKSVSYMSQERAIIYTKVFLSIWNRTRALKKMEMKMVRRSKNGKGNAREKGRTAEPSRT